MGIAVTMPAWKEGKQQTTTQAVADAAAIGNSKATTKADCYG